MEGRKMREGERVGGGGQRGPEIGSGSGVSALGTLTSGGDMTRHAGSAQLGQRSVLPCCFGSALPSPDTHTHAGTGAQTDNPPSSVSYLDIHSLTGKHTQAHTQNAMVLARAGWTGGRGPWTNGNAKLVTLTLGDKGTLGCRCSC